MNIILLVVAVWLICRIIRTIREGVRQQRQEKELARIRQEQAERAAEAARIREEWKRQQAAAKEWTRRQIQLEREQMRIAKEQERQAKEQARQAEQLAKHEEQIATMNYRISQAEADIKHLTEQIGQYYALLDIAENQQRTAIPGSKADTTAQSKIITLTNKIYKAESRLNKAKFDKAQAEQKLSA